MILLSEVFKRMVSRVKSARGDWHRNPNEDTDVAYGGAKESLGSFTTSNADEIYAALAAWEADAEYRALREEADHAE